MEGTNDSPNRGQLTPAQRLEVEREHSALAPSELLSVGLEDIHQLLRRLARALSALQAEREGLLAALPAFDWALLDRLPVYALALAEAHEGFRAVPTATPDLHVLGNEGRKLRERMLEQANALVVLGLLDARRMRALRGSAAYESVAFDLRILVAELAPCWALFATPPESALQALLAAQQLDPQLAAALGAKGELPVLREAARDQRRRAYTLLLRKYDELRQAVTCARRLQGDAATLTPSLGPRGAPARAWRADG